MDFLPVDHYALAVQETPSQLRQPVYLAFLAACCTAIQRLEDDALFVIEDTTIDNATGDALRQFARLVGESSSGVSTIDLRRLIRARILAGRSNGTVDRILEVLAQAAGTEDVRHYDVPPARAYLAAIVDAPAPDLIRRRIGAMMRQVKPAGVSLTLIEAQVGYFGFAEDPNAQGFDVGPLAREYE